MARFFRQAMAALVGVGLLATAACTYSSTPYQPISSANRVSGGYSDEQLGEYRFRVSFAGNSLTSREQVESYLLFRAAELTLEQGHTWFVIEERVIVALPELDTSIAPPIALPVLVAEQLKNELFSNAALPYNSKPPP